MTDATSPPCRFSGTNATHQCVRNTGDPIRDGETCFAEATAEMVDGRDRVLLVRLSSDQLGNQCWVCSGLGEVVDYATTEPEMCWTCSGSGQVATDLARSLQPRTLGDYGPLAGAAVVHGPAGWELAVLGSDGTRHSIKHSSDRSARMALVAALSPA